MTVADLIARTLTSHCEGQLRERLEPIHQTRLRDLKASVESGVDEDRDIWPRWKAIRYIDTVFSGRFDRERDMVGRLAHRLTKDDLERLWVAGELVSALRWQLRNAVGLCHHGAEFSVLTAKLLRAVDDWFTVVEETAGSMSWKDLPGQVREDVEFLATETPPWGDLPASLVTSL